MANSILTSHYSGTSNTILVSHGWPSGSSANSVLGSHDGDYPASGDTTPDAFSFTDQTDVAVNTTRTSNTITVAGITAAASISITGGEYQIGAGSFTSASGTVTNGQTVTVRHTSSASNSTATNTVLTIGGISDTFTSTTLAASGTTLTDGASFTITGSGFGTRNNAPFYFDNYESYAVDQTAVQVGLASLDGEPEMPVIKTDQSHSGTKSLRMDYLAASTSMFPRIGVEGLSTDRVYVSAWMRFARHTGTGGVGVFKLVRSSHDPAYSGAPRFYETIFTDGAGTYVDSTDRGSVPSSGSPTNYDNALNAVPSPGAWCRLEYYYQLSTAGVADGVFKSWVNGTQNANITTDPNRASGNSNLLNNVISVFDGMDSYPSGTGWYVWMDSFYVDSTQQRLELGNASTWAACTQRELQPSTAWSDTSITALCQKGAIPTGTAYLFVIGADGTASAGIEVDVA